MSRTGLPPIPRFTSLWLCLSFALVACSSSPTAEAPQAMPDFEGSYSVTGTYYPRTGANTGLFGSLEITNQQDAAATASVAVELLDNGNTSFALNTPSDAVAAAVSPAQAVLGNDGSFSLTFTGREEIFGIDPADCCAFTLTFDGTLSGTHIAGNWVLTTDMPSRDEGSFTAAR